MPPHAGEIEIEQDDIWAGGGLGFLIGAFAMQIRQGFVPITHNAQVVGQQIQALVAKYQPRVLCWT